MTELVFIRHGETDWNRQQRFQGQIDVPLNATGLAQAQRLARRLAAEPPGLLVSSDLQRALQTAAPLAAAWAQQTQLWPGLREQSFGVLEGLDVPTIQQQHPDLWRDWLTQEADYALPGGESNRQFHGRIWLALQELVATHAEHAAYPGQRMVVVTHGGVLDMLWRSARGDSLHGLRQCLIPNTGINRLRWADGALHIEVWGDAEHLSDDVSE